MGLKDIKPGKSILATPVRMRFGTSQEKGTPFAEVEFKIKENGEKLRWQGYLTEKTLERTMDTLALIEYNDDPACPPECLNIEKEVALTIELESYVDKQGISQEMPRIRWVNDPNYGRFETLDASSLKSKLGGVNLKAEMAAARARLGTGKKSPTTTPQQAETKEEVPW